MNWILKTDKDKDSRALGQKRSFQATAREVLRAAKGGTAGWQDCPVRSGSRGDWKGRLSLDFEEPAWVPGQRNW